MKFNFYKIVNKINHKEYIGISVKPIKIRFKEHKSLLRRGKHHNYLLQRDWDFYGEENFDFILLETLESNSVEEGYNHEYELISEGENLYNLVPGGKINPMYSEKVKQKMINTKQGQFPNIYQLEEIEENVFKVIGKFNSQKEAQRITGLSQANIGRSIKNHVKGSGYYWVEEDTLNTFEKEWRPVRTKIKPTAELNDNNEIVKVHHNRSLFEREYGWKTGAIKGAISRNGKAHGVKFINIDEETYYKIKPIRLLF